jgi:peptidoglycan/xylan/chitin deacetylase (PgdA/CDA1 family)
MRRKHSATDRMQFQPELLIFAFHALFESAREITLDTMDPQQAITVKMFREFVSDMREQGYRFVASRELLAGLAPTASYAMISFDDGYANNRRALGVMEEFEVPALFSISSNPVLTGKPFWWDVLYREASERAWPPRQLQRMRAALKRMRAFEIERQLLAEFGEAAFRTVAETGRPFRPSELADFARHPLVEIGNHTADHAILTNYCAADAFEQIQIAQKHLAEITGKIPQVIAYPNGNVSSAIIRAARAAGLRLGMTTRAGRVSLASLGSAGGAMQLKRYTLWGTRDIAAQCRAARARISLRSGLGMIRAKLGAWQERYEREDYV